MEVPALAPRKALKVSASPTAQQAADAQTAVQPDVASARADLKGSVVQEEAPRAAMEQTEEEGPTPCVVEAHESDGAKAPPVAKAGSKAEAPGTPEAKMVEVCMVGPVARDSEMEVGQPLVPPLAQGLPAAVGERPGGSGDLSCEYFPVEGAGGCRGGQHSRAASSGFW